MKKILMIVAILSASVLGFADAKADYANAEKLAKENKITESVKILEKLSASTDKEYATKADFQLGVYYLQKNDTTNAKKYLMKIWNSAVENSEDKQNVAALLYTTYMTEKNISEAQKYIEWADSKIGATDVDTASSLILFYFDNNMKSKGDARYTTAMKSTNADYKAELNFNIGQYFLTKNDIANGKRYLQTSYNAAPSAIVPAGYLLSQIEANSNNVSGAEKILLDMNSKTGNKDPEVLMMLGTFYLQSNNLTKAEENFKKVATANTKDVDSRVLLLGVYELKGDTAKVNSTYNELKTITGGKSLNKNLGSAYANLGNGVLAEKYLKKSIAEDKDNQSKVLLGQVYALTGKKTEAVALLKEAVNNKVAGASEVLKQVEAMK